MDHLTKYDSVQKGNLKLSFIGTVLHILISLISQSASHGANGVTGKNLPQHKSKSCGQHRVSSPIHAPDLWTAGNASSSYLGCHQPQRC